MGKHASGLLKATIQSPLITKLPFPWTSHFPSFALIRSNSCSFAPRNAHSHTMATLQLVSVYWRNMRLSRLRLPCIFSRQNLARVDGQRNRRQAWPCQKQPWTNMTAWKRLRTRSGLPGSVRSWSRYLYPARWSPRRTRTSIFVSRPLIADMILDRVSRSCRSAISWVPEIPGTWYPTPA